MRVWKKGENEDGNVLVFKFQQIVYKLHLWYTATLKFLQEN